MATKLNDLVSNMLDILISENVEQNRDERGSTTKRENGADNLRP